MCLYEGLLPYLCLVKSAKFSLCFSFLRNYVFESMGLLCFKNVLDSVTNYPKEMSIRI